MFKNQTIFIYSKYKYKKDVSITVRRVKVKDIKTVKGVNSYEVYI